MTASEMRHEVGTARTVADAVAAVTEALARRQFSVLWDLDVNAKLREKGLELGVPYRIPTAILYQPEQLVAYSSALKGLSYDGANYLDLPQISK